MSTPSASSGRLVRLALAASAVLLLCALALFYYASRSMQERHQAAAGQITVTVQAKGCEPNALSVPAGPASFRIVNGSERAVEWEILDGVMVVEERENIAPGLSETINTRLAPGDYAITCGLLSNPRGTLHVSPTTESERAAAAPPQLRAFLGPLAEYRVYLSQQSRALARQIDALRDAVGAGDLVRAQAAYRAAHVAYHGLLPLAQYVAELDNRLNAPAAYFEQREQDPGFAGFHRIEYALFAQHATAGLAPVVDALASDAEALKAQLMAQQPTPDRLLAGGARLLRNLADNRLDGGEERYAHDDLASIAADQAAVERIVELLRPVLARSAAPALQRIDEARQRFSSALDDARQGDPARAYDDVTAAQRDALGQAARQFADALDALGQSLAAMQ